VERFDPGSVRALTFDVFGTLVDWRASVAAEVRRFGLGLDPEQFADDWRDLYQPSMERVRSGAREWTPLDALHRESLDELLDRHGVGDRLDEAARQDLNFAWHRLRAWPDSAPGLARLRTGLVTATLSNGNVSLLIDLARCAGLSFDAILSAELSQAYKPLPAAYLKAAALLGLEPQQVMMVAAHPDDLRAASSNGLRTAYVARPLEYGRPAEHHDPPGGTFDIQVASLTELADAFGPGGVT